MAFDAAQILRQTYAAGAEAAQMRDLAEPQKPVVQVEKGELMGTAFTVEADPVAELMDSMEELSFQFEENEAKREEAQKKLRKNKKEPPSAELKKIRDRAEKKKEKEIRKKLAEVEEKIKLL